MLHFQNIVARSKGMTLALEKLVFNVTYKHR